MEGRGSLSQRAVSKRFPAPGNDRGTVVANSGKVSLQVLRQDGGHSVIREDGMIPGDSVPKQQVSIAAIKDKVLLAG